jgi:hypothetical protein
MKNDTREEIIAILEKCINGTIKRVSKQMTYRPFHEALLTKELVAASAFERSFSTSFGQGPIEEISRILAVSTGAECVRQKETRANINKGAVDEIGRILSSLRDGISSPNWKKELSRIAAFTKGDFVQNRILSDIWIRRNDTDIFISIKTVKPNIDQTEIAKKDMLMLKAHDPKYETYFALYYNPGGPKREDYNWSVPFKIFDMRHDDCVLIGQEYWDFIGGKNTYQALVEIFGEVGDRTKNKLKELGH